MFCQHNSPQKISVMVLLVSLLALMTFSPMAYARVISAPAPTPTSGGGSEGDPLDSNDYAGGGGTDDRLDPIVSNVTTSAVSDGDVLIGIPVPKFASSLFGIQMLLIMPDNQSVVLILPTPEIWKLVEGRYVK